MLPQPAKVQIDEVEYTIGHWTVDQSTETFAWIIEAFGPTFRSIFQATADVEQMKSDTEVGLHFLEVVAKNLPTALKPKEYAQRCKELVSGVLANNSPIIYNNQFTGRILHLHKLIFQVLKFQYADFLDVALAYRK